MSGNMAKLLKNHKDLAIVLSRTYSFKTDLKIKWVRPEKIPSIRPEKSGDLTAMPAIDTKQPLPEFRNSKELETANEYVKRLFSLEFSPQKCQQKLYLQQCTDKVKQHEYDERSLEARLGRWTGYIRAWQQVMEKYPHNKVLKVQLKELIEKRKKYMKFLRQQDYKKFEWLLEQLDVVYKAPPPEYKWVTRKDSLVKLTDKYCEDIKQERLAKLRSQFEAEQPSFLEEKLQALQFIRDEEKECGVEVSITQEEINEVNKHLELLKSRQVKEEEF